MLDQKLREIFAEELCRRDRAEAAHNLLANPEMLSGGGVFGAALAAMARVAFIAKIAAMMDVAVGHDRRVTELLDANNKELERRRALQVAVRNVLDIIDRRQMPCGGIDFDREVNFMRAKLIDCECPPTPQKRVPCSQWKSMSINGPCRDCGFRAGEH